MESAANEVHMSIKPGTIESYIIDCKVKLMVCGINEGIPQ